MVATFCAGSELSLSKRARVCVLEYWSVNAHDYTCFQHLGVYGLALTLLVVWKQSRWFSASHCCFLVAVRPAPAVLRGTVLLCMLLPLHRYVSTQHVKHKSRLCMVADHGAFGARHVHWWDALSTLCVHAGHAASLSMHAGRTQGCCGPHAIVCLKHGAQLP